MLRRRILASAMASVMAIGSVAVVASAEDTAAATTQVKTKADLEAYVKSFDSFRAKEINDYASGKGEDFLDALEYADNVIDDSASTVDDYTVAYQMITATYNALKIYTAEELSALIKANKSKYETNNIYNEELGDIIYKNPNADNKNLWDNFANAYENAEDVLESKDSRIISDAYEELSDAVSNLETLNTVTKSQFRTALKTYETLKQNVYKYDTWRRGTLPGWADIPSGNYWKFGGHDITFGALYGYAASFETAIYDAYDKLDSYKSVSKTSLQDIVDQYIQLSDLNALLSAWTPDDTGRSSKASVKSLIDKYRGALVFNYAQDDAYALFDNLAAVVTLKKNKNEAIDSKFPWSLDKAELEDQFNFANTWYDNSRGSGYTVYKMTDASMNVYVTSNVWIPVDSDGKYVPSAAISTKAVAKKDCPNGVENYKLIAKNSTVDLTDYISLVGKVGTSDERLAFADAATKKTTAGDTAEVKAAAAFVAANSAALAKPNTTRGGQDLEANVKAAGGAILKAYNTYMKGYQAAYNAAAEALDVLAGNTKTRAAVSSEALYNAVADLKAALGDLADYISDGGDKRGAALEQYCKDTGFEWNLYWVDTALAEEFYAKASAAATAAADTVSVADIRAEKAEAATLAKTNADGTKVYYTDGNVLNGDKNQIIDKVGEVVDKSDGTNVVPAAIKMDVADGTIENKEVSLAVAMYMAEMYMDGDKDVIKAASPLYSLSTTGEIADDSAKASTAEWTLVYRYLKYALSDKYDLTTDSYTKAQVVELLEKSYDLAEKTGDAALFAVRHQELVDARKEAAEWIAGANKDKKYKDNVTTIDGLTSSAIYRRLDNAYYWMNKDFEAFKYSFGEIYTNLSVYAEMIDEGELEANDTLKAAMEQTALALSNVVSLDDDGLTLENDAFTTDRQFLDFNRVYTSTDKGNPYKIRVQSGRSWIEVSVPKANSTTATRSHFELMNAYDALQAEVKKQTTPTTVLGDVNGDGVVNALDAAAILKAAVNNTAIDVAVGDYNADGAVNALDAAAILKFVVSKA